MSYPGGDESQGIGEKMDGNFEISGAGGREGLVTIADGLATVEIAPAIGGALASYRWENNGHAIDWLRPAGPAALAGRDAGAMACFPLVP